MGWLWWLLAPAAVSVAASVVTWWTGRPRPAPSTEQSSTAHRRFLADLDRWSPSGGPPGSADPPGR